MFGNLQKKAAEAARIAQAQAVAGAIKTQAIAAAGLHAATGEDERKKKAEAERVAAEQHRQNLALAQAKAEADQLRAQLAAKAAAEAKAKADAEEAERQRLKAEAEVQRQRELQAEEDARRAAAEEAAEAARVEAEAKAAAEEAAAALAAAAAAADQAEKDRILAAAKALKDAADVKAVALATQKAKAAEEARACRKAMEGFTTDTSSLINLLSTKNNAEMTMLKDTYNVVIQPRNFMKDVKSACSGEFEDVLVALATDRVIYDAECLNNALSGLLTANTEIITEILTTRTSAELQAVSAAYSKLGKDLRKDLQARVGANPLSHVHMCALYEALLNPSRGEDGKENLTDDCKTLYEAGEAKLVGCATEVFVKVLGARSRAYTDKLNAAYIAKYGKDLTKVIIAKQDNAFGRCLANLLTPVAEVFAGLLEKSMSGLGCRDADLIRLVVSQREFSLKEAAAHLLKETKRTLKAWVEDECGGDYKKVMLAIVGKYC